MLLLRSFTLAFVCLGIMLPYGSEAKTITFGKNKGQEVLSEFDLHRMYKDEIKAEIKAMQLQLDSLAAALASTNAAIAKLAEINRSQGSRTNDLLTEQIKMSRKESVVDSGAKGMNEGMEAIMEALHRQQEETNFLLGELIGLQRIQNQRIQELVNK